MALELGSPLTPGGRVSPIGKRRAIAAVPTSCLAGALAEVGPPSDCSAGAV